MATVDKTGTTSATSVPSRKNPGVRTPYLVENTIDISKINSSAGTADGDVLQVLDVPAETLVLHAGIEVITALSSSVTMDFGITGGDVDVFVDGDANATGYSVLTATARPIIASADTIDLLVAGAASSVGKVRVFALMCDVSGVYETANNA